MINQGTGRKCVATRGNHQHRHTERQTLPQICGDTKCLDAKIHLLLVANNERCHNTRAVGRAVVARPIEGVSWMLSHFHSAVNGESDPKSILPL